MTFYHCTLCADIFRVSGLQKHRQSFSASACVWNSAQDLNLFFYIKIKQLKKKKKKKKKMLFKIVIGDLEWKMFFGAQP